MNGLAAAVIDITAFLEGHHIPHMIIGGFANLYWGRPRLTEDIDVKVQVAEANWPDFISRLSEKFQALPPNPLEFARETGVIPLAGAGGVRIDLIFAGLPYEEEAIRRAVLRQVEGVNVRLCTAEDLILHKLVSERLRDAEDVEGVILRQGAGLDRAYLDPLVRGLEETLARPEIGESYRRCLVKAKLDPGNA